jgi:four helix bundle protein
MEELHHANSFRDLIVYQKARVVAKDIFQISKSFPKDETYSLTDQLRRSSRSVGAQIAEAWGKRQYKKHFLSKLTDADAEQLETQHWIDAAFDCGYVTQDQQRTLLVLLCEIGRMFIR